MPGHKKYNHIKPGLLIFSEEISTNAVQYTQKISINFHLVVPFNAGEDNQENGLYFGEQRSDFDIAKRHQQICGRIWSTLLQKANAKWYWRL